VVYYAKKKTEYILCEITRFFILFFRFKFCSIKMDSRFVLYGFSI